jgi:hypothetical protein
MGVPAAGASKIFEGVAVLKSELFFSPAGAMSLVRQSSTVSACGAPSIKATLARLRFKADFRSPFHFRSGTDEHENYLGLCPFCSQRQRVAAAASASDVLDRFCCWFYVAW